MTSLGSNCADACSIAFTGIVIPVETHLFKLTTVGSYEAQESIMRSAM